MEIPVRKLQIVTHCTLLATIPTLFSCPPNHLTHVTHYEQNQKEAEWAHPATYDEIVQMLEDLESGELEKKYSPTQLNQVNEYLATLAKEGVLPGEFEEEVAVEEDTYDLMYGEDSFFQLAYSLNNRSKYILVPAVFNTYSGYNIVQCGKISKTWKKTRKFVKKHKKSILIGAVVVVAVTAVTAAVIVVASTEGLSAPSRSSRKAASKSRSKSKHSDSNQSVPDSSPSTIPNDSQAPVSIHSSPIFESTMKEEISHFKEGLAQGGFFHSPSSDQGLSLKETGRVLGPLFAHESFELLNEYLLYYPGFFQEVQNITSQQNLLPPSAASDNPVDFGHNEIDRRFTSNCSPLPSGPSNRLNFNALSHQMRGEAARACGYYGQAVNDFSQAIDMNPTNPMPYLQRSASYFDMGQYERSFEDFHNFETQIEQNPQKNPFSTPEFTLGFAKGLPKGVYESGEGIILFLGDLITHPIHTATQLYDALSTLAKLARDDEWGMIGEVLSPEIHHLVTRWDTLPSDKRGELAGYAFGKHGADIAAPGAVAKIASKSAKSARELAAVLKNLQRAEGTLVLETAAGFGNTSRVGEIINSGKTSAFLGEEFGFTTKEMGQLQKTGKLEGAINDALENFATKSPSEAYIIAKSGGKHADLIPQYSGRSIKEIQKGIKSYDKQVAIHKDKIANPSTYCPDWNKMDPRHKKSLVEVKWPAEIESYTEQGHVLQSILDLKQ